MIMDTGLRFNPGWIKAIRIQPSKPTRNRNPVFTPSDSKRHSLLIIQLTLIYIFTIFIKGSRKKNTGFSGPALRGGGGGKDLATNKKELFSKL